MDMVERVARAIWAKRRAIAASQGIELEDWGDGTFPRANHVHEEARAAIEAMKEPTPEMVEAACGVDRYADPGEEWDAMIDAALQKR